MEDIRNYSLMTTKLYKEDEQSSLRDGGDGRTTWRRFSMPIQCTLINR